MSVKKRRCRNCKNYFTAADGRIINGGFYCCEDCIVQYGISNRSKAKKILEKEHNQKKRAFYASDIKTRREAAVHWFNRFIRLRDAGNGCISCGNNDPCIQYAAGHFVPAGSCSALRFDERNVHLQCNVRCNMHLSGNRSEYRKRLVEKIGHDAVNFLEGPQPKIKITADWYKAIEDTYKQKCQELESK